MLYFLTILLTLVQPPTAPITWQSLLRETSDLTTLTRLPAIPFTTHQFSSYDRASVNPNQREDWFANHDKGHCLYEGSVEKETPYYAMPTARGTKPSGMLPAGTRIGIARHRRNVPGYVYAYSFEAAGQPPQHAGYILASSYTPYALGAVLADISGPGCLTRIWSSNPGEAGRVRIYLDNQSTPTITTKLADLLSGEWTLHDAGQPIKVLPSPCACERARGYELLFPITFQERCLVVVEKPSLQYQINYRSYPAGTAITSFSMASLIEEQKTLHAQATALTSLTGPSPMELAVKLSGMKPSDKPDVQQATLEQPVLEPGQTKQLDLLEGPGKNPSRAIIQLEAQVQAVRMIDALRNVTLSITFDGTSQPQVEAPLGDFFSTAPGANPLSTLPLRVNTAGKLTSYWIMPYAKNARIVLKNYDTQQVTVQLAITHVPCLWNDRSVYFHANWRTNAFNSRPFQDWLLFEGRGQGHYVGTFLSVYNPVKEWWGEGDTKVWIDSATFPNYWGTGTDDDFGLGWASKAPFSLPWRAQPRHDGQSNGHEGSTSLFRARLLDRIAFEKSLKLELEVRHDQPNVQLNYAATSYWYALPGATTERTPITAELLRSSLPGGVP